MFPRVRHALLLALLLIVPLQSMAAALKPLLCPPHSHAHVAGSTSAAHDDVVVHHDEGLPHAEAHAPHPAQGDHSDSHTCCHHVLSGAIGVTALPAHHDFRVFSSSIQLLATLYIPELPQRPPRA